MRVSTNQVQEVAINAMLDQQVKLSKTQRQVATGQRIFQPSDDPVAAARIIDIQQVIDTVDQYQTSIHAGRARLEIEEGVLSSIGEILQRVRELTLQANNASQSNETRSFIGEEINQLLSEIRGLANSVDGNNDFLFAGTQVKFRPFSETTDGSFQYNGDDGQRMLQIGPDRQIAVGDSGTDVFRAIRNGNGTFTINENINNKGSAIADPGTVAGEYHAGYYTIQMSQHDPFSDITYQVLDANNNIIVPAGTLYKENGTIEFQGIRTSFKGIPKNGDSFLFAPSENQNIFSTLSQLVKTLHTARHSTAENASLGNKVNQTLVAIDQAMGNVLEIRSNTGARLRALDNQQEINTTTLVNLKEIQSEIRDLDYAEAVSRLNLRLTGLEASQKAYTRVQNLSLFNHI